MPDYTSILRRSISALPDPSPEVREAVYQRARAALARQLTAVDPPLSTREIERQHHELEEAVARLEAELAPSPAEEARETGPVEPVAPPVPPSRGPAPRPGLTERLRAKEDERPDADDDVDDDDYDEEEEEEERRSRLPLIAGVLLLVLVIGGAVAYGLAGGESLMSLLGISDSDPVEVVEAPPAEEPPAQPAEAPAGEVATRPDRLAASDEAPPGENPGETETALLPPADPEPPPPAEEPPAPPPPGVSEAEPPPAEEQTAALPPPGQSIVAQRSIYYFQGKEGSPGQATEGTVTWAQISKDNAPAIQATLRLAERDASAVVTISRNTDSTLPASHLVEIQFSGEFAASPIQRVPALVLKQTEQARGEPLNGAAVPVTDELFWIALSDNEEQIARNLQLLRDGSWFDIPILFNDGTRALLTFEKGIPGDQVFETVMSAWSPP